MYKKTQCKITNTSVFGNGFEVSNTKSTPLSIVYLSVESFSIEQCTLDKIPQSQKYSLGENSCQFHHLLSLANIYYPTKLFGPPC